MTASMGDRIRQLRIKAKLSQAAVGKLIGYSGQAVYSWEQNRTQPEAGKIPRLAEILGTSVGYLLTGATSSPHANGPGNLGLGGSAEVEATSRTWDGGRLIPLLAADRAAAGLHDPPLGFVTTYSFVGPRAYALAVWDESNAPDMAPGDRVVVDPDIEPRPGDFVFVSPRSGAPAVIGRYERKDDAAVVRHSNGIWGSHALSANAGATVHGTIMERVQILRRR